MPEVGAIRGEGLRAVRGKRREVHLLDGVPSLLPDVALNPGPDEGGPRAGLEDGLVVVGEDDAGAGFGDEDEVVD
jgi:hypothetical protein